MHLFLFAASEKSSRAFSKFEIVRMEPRNWEACEKCGGQTIELLKIALSTNHHPLSAIVVHRQSEGLRTAALGRVHYSMLGVSAHDKHLGVTVEGKVVVGRRLRRRASVHRPRPQGQSSPLWPQWAAAWPLVPRLRTLERPTLGSVRTFDPFVTQMYILLMQHAHGLCARCLIRVY